MKRRSLSEASALARGIRRGDRACAARAITCLENQRPGAEELLRRLYPLSGRSWVVGLTGPAGAGKSTLLDGLLSLARRERIKAGALLVDPSSPLSGGAFLGDRLRLERHGGDPGVFVRSLASRGLGGGTAVAAWGARRVLEALGAEVIFLETLGAGQADVDVAAFADTVAVVWTPGLGDEVQALKAGLLEIADVLVLNKADRPGRGQALAGLAWAAAPAGEDAGPRPWSRPRVQTVATAGRGVPSLWENLKKHRDHLKKSGEGGARRRRQAEAELSAYVRRRWDDLLSARLAAAARRLCDRRTDPLSAARRALKGIVFP